MNVDKDLQKQARKSMRGTDPSIAKYMQVLEHEVCHLEELNAQLNQKIEVLQQQRAG
ncbi:hypothetical protein MITS9509_01765 [Synechococcus sp. MIT S9509]|uniref:hypothetical protein n=1 Tax=Synechococcus sp. MIT S9509 TaxID=1801630 RepID=UPI0007BB4623|nr:hypothetical protein [Synechococcus sp. MIT S9509]KZR91844.1 hypothetical protein MITS9509_01765 [Synechococcus sp. MIT S9509]